MTSSLQRSRRWGILSSAIIGFGSCAGGAEVNLQPSKPIPALFYKGVDRTIAAAGAHITYTVTYRNRGPESVPEVVISDEVPLNTTLVSASNEPLTGSRALVEGRVVRWEVGTLPPSPIFSVDLTVQVSPDTPNGTFIKNTAEFAGKGWQAVVSNSVETMINTPAL